MEDHTNNDLPVEPVTEGEEVSPIVETSPVSEKAEVDISEGIHELEGKTELAIDDKSTATKEQVKEVTLGKYVSVKQLADAIGFGKAYISLLLGQGRIKGVKILGGQWRIPLSEYERLTKEGIVPMRKIRKDIPTTKIYAKGDDTVEEPVKAKDTKDEFKPPEEKPKERFPGFRFNFLGK